MENFELEHRVEEHEYGIIDLYTKIDKLDEEVKLLKECLKMAVEFENYKFILKKLEED